MTRSLGYDPTSPQSIEAYAKQLEGMTFRDVLALGIAPEGAERDYNDVGYKGGLGTLIEERFFGYKANSSPEPDFPEAGVELKVSCVDRKKDGDLSAGERLVLTMVPFDSSIEDDFDDSHLWQKSRLILLIYYERDRSLDKYDQVIRYVKLVTPSGEDLKMIREDYRKIASLVVGGKADELSEGLTSYLGACTKGATADTMWVDQQYPPYAKAKKRAFSFKRSYMDSILHTKMMGEAPDAEPIVKDASLLDEMTFEGYVLSLIEPHIGKTDRELCEMLGLRYTGNKAQWSQVVYALLGVRGDRADEFEKANISVRTVRVEERGVIKESLSLDTFKFKDIVEQDWEDSALREYFEETRFLFVTFRKGEGAIVLDGARFWNMSMEDIDGALRDCWERTKEVVAEGVELSFAVGKDGKVQHGKDGDPVIRNNLPKKNEAGDIAHVRPHAPKKGYRLEDGSEYGDPDRYGDELPDGRVMTQQSFWLNNDYVLRIIDWNDE